MWLIHTHLISFHSFYMEKEPQRQWLGLQARATCIIARSVPILIFLANSDFFFPILVFFLRAITDSIYFKKKTAFQCKNFHNKINYWTSAKFPAVSYRNKVDATDPSNKTNVRHTHVIIWYVYNFTRWHDINSFLFFTPLMIPLSLCFDLRGLDPFFALNSR